MVDSVIIWDSISGPMQISITALSFLGLGVRPPTPSWGGMIRDGVNQLLSEPWLSLAPGVAIFVVVLAFNMMGDGPRDILDPKTME